jgi:hypothetical protein
MCKALGSRCVTMYLHLLLSYPIHNIQSFSHKQIALFWAFSISLVISSCVNFLSPFAMHAHEPIPDDHECCLFTHVAKIYHLSFSGNFLKFKTYLIHLISMIGKTIAPWSLAVHLCNLKKTQLNPPPSKLQNLSPITKEPHQNALANVKSVHHFNKNYKTMSIVGLVKRLTNHLMLALKLVFHLLC